MENPSLHVSLDERRNDQKLYHAEEARIRRDGEPRRVLLQHGGLQHQPPRPRQAVPDQVQAPQRPVLPLGIVHPQERLFRRFDGGGGGGGDGVVVVCVVRGREYGRAFVEGYHRRARDAGQRAHELRDAVAAVEAHLLDPAAEKRLNKILFSGSLNF